MSRAEFRDDEQRRTVEMSQPTDNVLAEIETVRQRARDRIAALDEWLKDDEARQEQARERHEQVCAERAQLLAFLGDAKPAKKPKGVARQPRKDLGLDERVLLFVSEEPGRELTKAILASALGVTADALTAPLARLVKAKLISH